MLAIVQLELELLLFCYPKARSCGVLISSQSILGQAHKNTLVVPSGPQRDLASLGQDNSGADAEQELIARYVRTHPDPDITYLRWQAACHLLKQRPRVQYRDPYNFGQCRVHQLDDLALAMSAFPPSLFLGFVEVV
ncbi:Uncharacterized protein HZ326_29813 [Fusarium oxysporum f. sp. albedinis]|nr:Uncharacterized protein HZ326_29813 [Fusarium oxysporum f. sp. albedinis]